jgi:Novel STAND NTPase 1/FHA domain
MVSDSSQGSPAGVTDASSESDARRPTLDVENPWPGLAAYDEASRDFFHGREREALELLRLIRLAPLTTLYSKSGLGKSSLLQAGLFPLLREQHFLPVYLRIDFSEGATDPLEQVARRLEEELARAEAEYPERHGETLWRYLHREPLEIWSKDNFPLVPVLVFDQFEEMFLHRGSDPKRVEELRNSLADLIENRIPAELATDAAKPERSQLSLLSLHYRIVLSCREDFLPDLKSWEADVPSLLRNYLRLEPMTRQCAIEAVEASGGTVLAEGVAPLIVDFVGTIDERPNSSTEAVIEPVLLSLCCHQLNRRRKPGEKINKALVDRAGRDILDNFYQTALGDKDVKGPPDVATFIETYLIQGERFRGAYPKAEAIKDGLLAQTQLDALTNRHRLLRVVQHTDTARIELIHDRMVEVVCRARNERKTRERQVERERQAAQASSRIKQRLLRVAGAVIALALFAQFFAFSSYTQWEKNRPWATLDSAASGRRYPLQQDVANIGRRTAGVDVIYQVALLDRAVSRIHLMIFNNFNAVEVRSLYGTTVNGEFLQYGEQARLEDGDVIVLAGVAAFVFHPLTYQAWQYFWRAPLSDQAPPTGWGLLIDGKRRVVFPLTQDEVFIAPVGDNGIEPHDGPEGAIAVVRRRDAGPAEITWRKATVQLSEHRPEDPATAEVDLFGVTSPGARGYSRDLKTPSLTIEDVADGQPLEAEVKLDDYAYGRFVLPEARQHFFLRSTRGVRDHSISELAFHQGGRRFQVIWRDPKVEGPSRDKSP